jgi:peptide/nickel transport system ATP-binding protein
LEVRDLQVHYKTFHGDVVAANHVNFEVYKGETLGLVGESGCGKTTTAMAILRLVQPPGIIIGGEIWLQGKNLLALSRSELRKERWTELALIPQGAMNSLNPVMKIHDQIIKQRVLELFGMVGLPNRVYDLYPHELSGGMKQRVCVAMAVALNPVIIIADEPSSALDVVVQRVVVQSLLEVKEKLGVSMILIGHDMGLQAQLVDRIAVMYAGNIVEISSVFDTFENPMHPYTNLLIASIPSIKERKPLVKTEGITHDLRNIPTGCIFQYRCPQSMDICRQITPRMNAQSPRHFVACHLYEER